MFRASMIFVLSVGLVGLACSSSKDEPPPGPAPAPFTLTVSPAKLALVAGDNGSVTVAIQRATGFFGDVALSLVGGPAGLSGTFAPNPASGDSAVLTLQASTLGPGDYGAYVKGTSGAEKQATALEVTVRPDTAITVSGRVVDLLRQPIAGLDVRLGASTSTTNVAGRFSFPDVLPPYDLVVKRASPLEAHVFKGLTRPDPTLPLIGTAPAPARTAQVSGVLSGASFPQGASTVSALFFAADEGWGGVYLFPGQGPAYGPFGASWYGPTTESGTLYGLQWSVNSQLLPQSFLEFASAPLEVGDGGTVTGANLALQPAGTGFLSGTVTVPSGYTIDGKTLWLNAGPFTGVFLGTDGTPGTTGTNFTYAMPAVGLPVGVQISATRSGNSTAAYRANLLPNEVIDVNLPAPPFPQVPPSGTTGVTTATEFSWLPYPGSIHVAIFSSPSGADFLVYQAGTSTALPELSGFGLPLPPGAAYAWAVWGIGPFADLDAFAAPDRGLGLAGLDEDVLLGMSAARTFTTAP
jgi:hypothetical protein